MYSIDKLVERLLFLENQVSKLQDENRELKQLLEIASKASAGHRNESFPLDHLPHSNT